MEKKLAKPYLTYEEQLERLREKHGLNINNTEIGIEILKSISYYDLINGYKECFMKNEKFKPNTEITTIFAFSMFDKNFQNILFKYSIYVENTFKTRVAHVIGGSFGEEEEEYLSINKYSSPRNPKRLEKLEKTLDDIKDVLTNRWTDNPTKHYRKNHNHIPPWILFKNINFNSAIDLYTFLRRNEKEKVINEYFKGNNSFNDKAEVLKKMITIVRKFRNKIAHNYKVIGYKTKEELKITKTRAVNHYFLYTKPDIWRRESNDLFAMIVSLINLIGNKYLILNMISELVFLFESSEELARKYIKEAKLPENIIERLNNVSNYIKELN